MADSGEKPSILQPNWFTPQRLHLEQLSHGLIERGDEPEKTHGSRFTLKPGLSSAWAIAPVIAVPSGSRCPSK
jgi:hypothetical protein